MPVLVHFRAGMDARNYGHVKFESGKAKLRWFLIILNPALGDNGVGEWVTRVNNDN